MPRKYAISLTISWVINKINFQKIENEIFFYLVLFSERALDIWRDFQFMIRCLVSVVKSSGLETFEPHFLFEFIHLEKYMPVFIIFYKNLLMSLK
jgi:hypothetical protein